MDEINKVLGQVPQLVKEQGTPREKLEALWRLMGWHRSGLQTQVAGELAERWHIINQSPRIPNDDPRKAAKRLEKMLNGETTLPLDLSMVLIDCMPEPFCAAAKAMIFPRSNGVAGQLAEILNMDQQHDEKTDHIRFKLAMGDHSSLSPEELEHYAQAYDSDTQSNKLMAAALRALAEERRGAA